MECLFCDSGFGWTSGVCSMRCPLRCLEGESLSCPPSSPPPPCLLPANTAHPLLSSWCDLVIPLCFVFTVLWLSRCCSQLKRRIDVMTFSSLTTFWFPGVNTSHVAFCSIFYVLPTHPSPGCCPVVRILLPVQCSSPEKGGGEDTFCETSVVWKLLWCAYTLLLISMWAVNFPSQFWKFDLLSLSFHYCC